MERGYLARTWRCIKATKNWFGKLLLLGLIAMIPIFGIIVVSGYLYGWARDAAWRMDNPLPSRVLGNEAGMLYKRGLFAVIISVGLTLVVSVASIAFFWAFGLASVGVSSVFAQILPDQAVSVLASLAIPSLVGTFGLLLACMALIFGVQFFIWVGTMRMSIYGTLSSGFQFSRSWAMIRKNPSGLFKIFLGQLIASAVVGFIVAIIWCVVLFVGVFVSMLVMGAIDYSGSYGSAFGGVTAIGSIAAVFLALCVVYLTFFSSVLIQMFVCRSLGYWVADFDVAQWGSQDDPLPCEKMSGGAVDAGR